jgi:hypothetical protein
MSGEMCLRCDQVALVSVPVDAADIQFFRCPRCTRNYARKSGKPLTFRWGHPISLALYPVIFERAPVAVSAAQIDRVLGQTAFADLAAALAEIRLELASPTQPVRDMLDCVAPEAELRQYLDLYCERGDVLLAGRRDGEPN